MEILKIKVETERNQLERTLSGLFCDNQSSKKEVRNVHNQLAKKKLVVPFLSLTDRFNRFPAKQFIILPHNSKAKTDCNIVFEVEGEELPLTVKADKVYYMKIEKLSESLYLFFLGNTKKELDLQDGSKADTLAKFDGFETFAQMAEHYLKGKDSINLKMLTWL